MPVPFSSYQWSIIQPYFLRSITYESLTLRFFVLLHISRKKFWFSVCFLFEDLFTSIVTGLYMLGLAAVILLFYLCVRYSTTYFFLPLRCTSGWPCNNPQNEFTQPAVKQPDYGRCEYATWTGVQKCPYRSKLL